ncbi:MAG: hypothetical protein HQL06_10190 [Nitrospirae bacterium]|nr:hypothetical protein [Nitrospirota bacterium]
MQMILEARVDRLENLMAEVIELHRDLAVRFEQRERRDEERERRDEERERRDEERERRDEERDRKAEERERKAEEAQEAFRQEMRAMEARFEEWLKQNKKEREEERKAFEREINKVNADTSKQLGTLVENIIAPGARPLIRQYFKSEPYDFRVRACKGEGSNNCEVDILIITKDKAFMIEVKSKPDGRDVKKILAKAKILPTFFNECRDKQIIPMLASIVIDDNILTFATRKGLHVVAYRQWEYLDILNFDTLKEKNKGKDTPLT